MSTDEANKKLQGCIEKGYSYLDGKTVNDVGLEVIIVQDCPIIEQVAMCNENQGLPSCACLSGFVEEGLKEYEYNQRRKAYSENWALFDKEVRAWKIKRDKWITDNTNKYIKSSSCQVGACGASAHMGGCADALKVDYQDCSTCYIGGWLVGHEYGCDWTETQLYENAKIQFDNGASLNLHPYYQKKWQDMKSAGEIVFQEVTYSKYTGPVWNVAKFDPFNMTFEINCCYNETKCVGEYANCDFANIKQSCEQSIVSGGLRDIGSSCESDEQCLNGHCNNATRRTCGDDVTYSAGHICNELSKCDDDLQCIMTGNQSISICAPPLEIGEECDNASPADGLCLSGLCRNRLCVTGQNDIDDDDDDDDDDELEDSLIPRWITDNLALVWGILAVIVVWIVLIGIFLYFI